MDIFTGTITKTVAKGTLLLRAGEICKTGYLVQKGCLKSYVVDSTGKEHIIQFAPEGWAISDLDSIINKKPSAVFIEAIEDSEVVLLTKTAFEKIAKSSKEELIEMNNKLFRNIIAANKRLIALLSATAEERYLEFTDTYPTLVQRLPLKLIASYIGITPEYLSEIRRKITKNSTS